MSSIPVSTLYEDGSSNMYMYQAIVLFIRDLVDCDNRFKHIVNSSKIVTMNMILQTSMIRRCGKAKRVLPL